MNSQYLFVYGSLKKGYDHPMSEFLNQNAVFIGEATMKGELYLIDWYPGAVYNPDSLTSVYGHVFRLKDLSILDRLDDYENVEYIRKIVPVLQNQNLTQAWTYIWNGSLEGKALIKDGVFT